MLMIIIFLRASGRGSTRRKSSKTAPTIKGAIQPRPSWALFRKVTEGAESILFREKFIDWPEPGRIIKMKGHESSGETIKVRYAYSSVNGSIGPVLQL